MELTKSVTIFLTIAFITEGKAQIGIILDESIVERNNLRKYLVDENFLIKPVFISSARTQESDVPEKLKKVLCIVCISANNVINDEASRLGEMLKIPVITSSPNTGPIGKFTTSMYPDYELTNRVMVDSLKHWKINPVALLYDVKRSEQAANLQSQARKSNIRIFLMPEIKMNEEKSLSYAAGEFKRSHLTGAVLLCDPKHIYKVMDQTIDYNLYHSPKDKIKVYNLFALDLDFRPNCTSTLDGLVGFVTKNPKRKNESERIEKFTKQILTTHQRIYNAVLPSKNFYANLHDMLVLAARIAKDDHPGEKRLEALRKDTIPACQGGTFNDCGLSGQVRFNENGTRKLEEIKIVEIKKGSIYELKDVGDWTPKYNTRGAVTQMSWVQDSLDEGKRQKCHQKKISKRKMYRILVKENDEPFVFINKNKSLPVKERFTGYCIDIVEKLASEEYMNFNYTIEVQTGTGSVNENTSRWNGIIGELIDQKAEMATGSLTITAQREKAVDFSKPFMDFTMALILRKPVEEEPNMFRFLDPFSSIVWLCTVMAVFAMTIFMYIVDYLSPYGNRKTAKDSDEPGDEFSLYNSLWFATASMLQQGPDNTPKSPSGRLLGASFWFFVLLMISTYTANLAAFFTNKKPKSTITNLEDLAKQNKIKYGVYKGGQIHTFLKQNSNDTVYKKMVAHMTRFNTFAASASVGVEKARNAGFAYITEDPILEYYNSRSPCNTMLVKGLLEAKSYGFALPKNSELTTNLSVNILNLREQGFMEERYTYWWKTQSQCSTTEKPVGLDSMKIQFKSMAGVFIVLVSGVIISLILVVVEVKFKWLIDLILEAGCEQCTDYYCEEDESYEYMEPAVEATAPCSLKRVPDAYSNVQESKV